MVTNTGNTPLSLALVDAMCTGITGPTGNIVGGNLQVGGTATYTCAHVVVAADFPTYVNVAQVTATPPGGSPLPPQRSSVLANVPRQQALACTTSTTKLTETAKNLKTVRKTSKGKTVTTTNRQITAILSDPNHGTDISKVVFSLDGRPLKTLTKPNISGGRFEVAGPDVGHPLRRAPDHGRRHDDLRARAEQDGAVPARAAGHQGHPDGLPG